MWTRILRNIQSKSKFYWQEAQDKLHAMNVKTWQLYKSEWISGLVLKYWYLDEYFCVDMNVVWSQSGETGTSSPWSFKIARAARQEHQNKQNFSCLQVDCFTLFLADFLSRFNVDDTANSFCPRRGLNSDSASPLCVHWSLYLIQRYCDTKCRQRHSSVVGI